MILGVNRLGRKSSVMLLLAGCRSAAFIIGAFFCLFTSRRRDLPDTRIRDWTPWRGRAGCRGHHRGAPTSGARRWHRTAADSPVDQVPHMRPDQFRVHRSGRGAARTEGRVGGLVGDLEQGMLEVYLV